MAIINTNVEQEPTVLQIKGFVKSTFLSMILIDSSSTHNMMSVSFAQKIRFLLFFIKPCSVFLPNKYSNFITHRVLRVNVHIQRVNTEGDFGI